MYTFRLKFRGNLFPRVKLTIFQHWSRLWLSVIQVTNYYLNQWWLVYLYIYASFSLNEFTTSIDNLSYQVLKWMIRYLNPLSNILKDSLAPFLHTCTKYKSHFHWLAYIYIEIDTKITLSMIAWVIREISYRYLLTIGLHTNWFVAINVGWHFLNWEL